MTYGFLGAAVSKNSGTDFGGFGGHGGSSLEKFYIGGSYLKPLVSFFSGSSNDGVIIGRFDSSTTAPEMLTVEGNISASGDVIANRYIVNSTVSTITQSFSSGSTIFGDTPADDTHRFTGSMFISGSGNPSLTVDGKIALRSGTPGNQQISFGNTDQFIQGHDNYIIFDGDDQVVVKADTKINIDSPVVGIGGFTTNSTPTATLHISGAGDTKLFVEGDISASGDIIKTQRVKMTNSSSVINTFNTSSHQTSKYTLQVTSASFIQSSEMLVIQSGSNAFNTEYAQINSGLNLLDFTSKVNGSNVELIGSGSFISCSVKFVRTII